mmetsp:Transcript_51602/g.81962  ORF Transcript_51602/g.81962 Transcript_51602/m.81962 type:complete len:280 (+) Transcript_51602:62-901(+)
MSMLRSASFFILLHSVAVGQAMRIGLNKLLPAATSEQAHADAPLVDTLRASRPPRTVAAESMLQSRLSEASLAAHAEESATVLILGGSVSLRTIGLISGTVFTLFLISLVVYAGLMREPKLVEANQEKREALDNGAESDDCATADQKREESDSGPEVKTEPSTIVQAAATKTLRFASRRSAGTEAILVKEENNCDTSTDDEEDPASLEFRPKFMKQQSCPALLKAYHWEPVLESSSDESESGGEDEQGAGFCGATTAPLASAISEKKKGKQRTRATTAL